MLPPLGSTHTLNQRRSFAPTRTLPDFGWRCAGSLRARSIAVLQPLVFAWGSAVDGLHRRGARASRRCRLETLRLDARDLTRRDTSIGALLHQCSNCC